MRILSRALRVGAVVTVAAGMSVALAVAAQAGDSPAGFHFGTDSWPVSIPGKAPYTVPVTGGTYGGYIGMAGNWARVEGCKTGNFLAWSATNSAQANTDYSTYHVGIGTGVYWYMGGPGVDPHWNGTTGEASAWGAAQAADTLAAMKSLHVTYPVVWADIELPGIAPAPDNGWNSVYTSPCSGKVKQNHVPWIVDRAEFNGFAAYITGHSTFKVGVYSSPTIWPSIFGTGSASLIPNTYEWTYWPETSNLHAYPYAWRLSQGKSTLFAQFFGGQTYSSPFALMWQWSGGGGVRNGLGDFDQIDVARMR
ncbi:MAG TPA: hypothetical protein VK719_12880 [Trebonia sp.]|nr:hypothetical protein [Trebonia sp.]